jgi:hypothetical protein
MDLGEGQNIETVIPVVNMSLFLLRYTPLMQRKTQVAVQGGIRPLSVALDDYLKVSMHQVLKGPVLQLVFNYQVEAIEY